MVGVGINENVYISKVEVNEKLSLVITIRQKVENKKSFFEQMQETSGGEVIADVDTLQLRLFPLTVPKDSANYVWTEEDRISNVQSSIREYQNQLTHICSVFLPSDQIKFDAFLNTGITAENVDTMLMDDAVLGLISNNLFTQFVALMSSNEQFMSDAWLLRFKLVRSGKDKHYPRLPQNRYGFSKAPFVERMDDPTVRVKFTEAEISKGLNIAEHVTADEAADAKSDDAPNGAFFGNR